jgi:hypothetical protein
MNELAREAWHAVLDRANRGQRAGRCLLRDDHLTSPGEPSRCPVPLVWYLYGNPPAFEVTNTSWIRATAGFVKKEFSIHLDTCPHKEQYELVISLFEAKLPLLSPFAVSLKDKLRIER